MPIQLQNDIRNGRFFAIRRLHSKNFKPSHVPSGQSTHPNMREALQKFKPSDFVDRRPIWSTWLAWLVILLIDWLTDCLIIGGFGWFGGVCPPPKSFVRQLFGLSDKDLVNFRYFSHQNWRKLAKNNTISGATRLITHLYVFLSVFLTQNFYIWKFFQN